MGVWDVGFVKYIYAVSGDCLTITALELLNITKSVTLSETTGAVQGFCATAVSKDIISE